MINNFLALQSLIKMYLTTVKAVKLEVRPLFLPQLVRLTSMLRPGLNSINVCKEMEIVTIEILINFHLENIFIFMTCSGQAKDG